MMWLVENLWNFISNITFELSCLYIRQRSVMTKTMCILWQCAIMLHEVPWLPMYSAFASLLLEIAVLCITKYKILWTNLISIVMWIASSDECGVCVHVHYRYQAVDLCMHSEDQYTKWECGQKTIAFDSRSLWWHCITPRCCVQRHRTGDSIVWPYPYAEQHCEKIEASNVLENLYSVIVRLGIDFIHVWIDARDRCATAAAASLKLLGFDVIGIEVTNIIIMLQNMKRWLCITFVFLSCYGTDCIQPSICLLWP